jgi:hypothetical protein
MGVTVNETTILPATWTAPPVERSQPDRLLGEKATLDAFLDLQRRTLLTKCAGLTEDQLKSRPNPGSKMSLLGLVRHLTEVEEWFAEFAQVPMLDRYITEANDDGDWDDIDTADAGANIAEYQAQWDRSASLIGDSALHDTVVLNPASGKQTSLRWIYLHVLLEYARHLGHADILRERIDGSTGE